MARATTPKLQVSADELLLTKTVDEMNDAELTLVVDGLVRKNKKAPDNSKLKGKNPLCRTPEFSAFLEFIESHYAHEGPKAVKARVKAATKERQAALRRDHLLRRFLRAEARNAVEAKIVENFNNGMDAAACAHDVGRNYTFVGKRYRLLKEAATENAVKERARREVFANSTEAKDAAAAEAGYLDGMLDRLRSLPDPTTLVEVETETDVSKPVPNVKPVEHVDSAPLDIPVIPSVKDVLGFDPNEGEVDV